MGVTPKIFNCIAESVECFFYVRAPVLCIKGILPLPERAGIFKSGAGGRKNKGAVFVKQAEAGHKLSLEFIPQNPDRNKKVIGREAYLMVLCKTASGNNTVHMDMVGKLLVPGMEDLYDAGHSPEIFPA